MGGTYGKRLHALEQRDPPVLSLEIRAYAERLVAEAGVSADELIAEAERLMRAVGPPYSMQQAAALNAGETGAGCFGCPKFQPWELQRSNRLPTQLRPQRRIKRSKDSRAQYQPAIVSKAISVRVHRWRLWRE